MHEVTHHIGVGICGCKLARDGFVVQAACRCPSGGGLRSVGDVTVCGVERRMQVSPALGAYGIHALALAGLHRYRQLQVRTGLAVGRVPPQDGIRCRVDAPDRMALGAECHRVWRAPHEPMTREHAVAPNIP